MKNSLVSASKWLSSTAIRFFNSSTDEIETKDGLSNSLTDKQGTFTVIKKNRGRPRKLIKDVKNRQQIPKKESTSRRSSASKSGELVECGPRDGERRFLLTLQALPTNFQIIATNIYPPTRNKYEEHRLVCKIINENCPTKQRDIFIPTFRKIIQLRTIRDAEKGLIEQESMEDDDCLQRHRPLELAERRERRREEELIRYELYIKKLSKEYPELQNRKYLITSDNSISSVDY